jgi:hypothetical protein
MTSLKDMLVEAADDARVYDMTDRAVRVVKRRRTMTRLVPVAAALLVVAGLVGIGRPFSGDGGGQQPSAAVDGLPQRLIPEKSPPMLPEDRGVGPARLAFSAAGRSVLLTEDDRQYRVDGLSVGGLSPDGRWMLVVRSDGGWVLRELTGTRRQEFTGGDTSASWRWSRDGGRLVMQLSSRTGVTHVVDLSTAARTTLTLDPARSGRVCAVRNSGELVLCASDESPFSGIRLADGRTGQVTREISVADLGLAPNEGMAQGLGMPMLDVDDHTLLVPVHDSSAPDAAMAPEPPHRNNSLVGFDLSTGRLTTQRYPLPDRLPVLGRPLSGGTEYSHPDARFVVGVHPDGVLLVHITPSRSDPFEPGPSSIELISRDTGTLHLVTNLARPIGLITYPG